MILTEIDAKDVRPGMYIQVGDSGGSVWMVTTMYGQTAIKYNGGQILLGQYDKVTIRGEVIL